MELKSRIRTESGLAYLLYVGLYGQVGMILFLTDKREQFFLQVIRRAAFWIQQWAFLLPQDQREIMDTGCNRLLTVTQDFFFQAAEWRRTNRLQNG